MRPYFQIPLFRADFGAEELRGVTSLLTKRQTEPYQVSHDQLQRTDLEGDGAYTALCLEWIKRALKVKHAWLTTSGTTSLELAALAAGLGPGDEVIMPSYTYVSTVNAVARTGAIPVFVDVKPDTMCLDEALVETAVTPATKAIIPVHYAGGCSELWSLLKIADAHKLLIIEDAAQGFLSSYGQHRLGVWGDMGAFSFHSSKGIVAGQGGCLVTNDDKLAKQIELVFNKGTNRLEFLKGNCSHFNWQCIGSNFTMPELSAAVLWGQLQRHKELQQRRLEQVAYYDRHLSPLFGCKILTPKQVIGGCEPNHSVYWILANSVEEASGLSRWMGKAGIEVTFHFVPLHTAPANDELGFVDSTNIAGTKPHLPVTENQAFRLLRLPLYHQLTPEKQQLVVDRLKSFYQQRQQQFDDVFFPVRS